MRFQSLRTTLRFVLPLVLALSSYVAVPLMDRLLAGAAAVRIRFRWHAGADRDRA